MILESFAPGLPQESLLTAFAITLFTTTTVALLLRAAVVAVAVHGGLYKDVANNHNSGDDVGKGATLEDVSVADLLREL